MATPQIHHKTCTLESLKFADDETGVFTGIASAVGVVDRHNEVIEEGAFSANNLDKSFPLLWQHNPSQPIGVVKFGLNAKGDLVVERGEINLDTQAGKEAHSLMRQGAVQSMSIGFNIPDGGIQWDDTAKVARISAVKVWEVSLVTFPANPGAVITSVKELADTVRHEVKAGRVLSAANRSKIADAVDALNAVLDADAAEKRAPVGHADSSPELDGVKQVLASWQRTLTNRMETDNNV